MSVNVDDLAQLQAPPVDLRKVDLRDLDPLQRPTVDLELARRVIGVGRSAAYAAVADGSWPTPIIRVGSRIRVPTAPLLRLVGQAPY